MQLEWATTVCMRRQLVTVVGMAFSLFPLTSTSSSSSSLAILLKEEETHGAGSQKVIMRQVKKKITHNKNERGIYYDFKDSSKIHL